MDHSLNGNRAGGGKLMKRAWCGGPRPGWVLDHDDRLPQSEGPSSYETNVPNHRQCLSDL